MILSGRHHCRLCGACICRDCCQALFYHGLAEIISFSKKVIELISLENFKQIFFLISLFFKTCLSLIKIKQSGRVSTV